MGAFCNGVHAFHVDVNLEITFDFPKIYFSIESQIYNFYKFAEVKVNKIT